MATGIAAGARLRVEGSGAFARLLSEVIAPDQIAACAASAGDVVVVACATSEGITRVDVVSAGQPRTPAGMRHEPALEPVARLIARCLDEHDDDIDALPLDVAGTRFQVEVWRALRELRAGETTTYGALAQRLGCGAGGARAVGQAVGANPAPIVVPCHRVMASGGRAGGFALGLAMKRRLLVAEGALLA